MDWLLQHLGERRFLTAFWSAAAVLCAAVVWLAEALPAAEAEALFVAITLANLALILRGAHA